MELTKEQMTYIGQLLAERGVTKKCPACGHEDLSIDSLLFSPIVDGLARDFVVLICPKCFYSMFFLSAGLIGWVHPKPV